ncbi:MAG: cation transporter [Proteobacteria bacterium]|nr:cation transporter [Pseudomonadota bacterium]
MACDGDLVDGKPAAEQRVLRIALLLNATMAVVGALVGALAQSTAVWADALDMASDAAVYGVGLVAIHRSRSFKAQAARASGYLLMVIGIVLLVEVARRSFAGSEPVSWPMIASAMASLGVNVFVLHLLQPLRSGDVHLRAAWIFTRADVIASIGVVAAGVAVAYTGSRYPDLVVGAAIGVYVVKEAFEILHEAGTARADSNLAGGSK